MQKLEKFLLELGTEFAFVGRQKRITVANQDFFIDLLFYHRGLHALLVIGAMVPGIGAMVPGIEEMMDDDGWSI